MGIKATERIDIHKLTLPEAKLGYGFDLDSFVEPAWPEILERLKYLRTPADIDEYMLEAAYAIILRPERRDELGLNSETKKLIKEELDQYKYVFQSFEAKAYQAKILTGDDNTLDTKLSSSLKSQLLNSNVFFADIFANAAIYEQFKEFFTEEKFHKATDYCASYNEKQNYLVALGIRASAKLIYSDKIEEFEFSHEASEFTKKEIERCLKEGAFADFLLYAFLYKINMAETVKLSESGLEIEMPKSNVSIESEVPAFPEVKRYGN